MPAPAAAATVGATAMMQIDLQSSFLVGSSMAALARRRFVGASDDWLDRTRIVVLAFAGIVFAPVWLYITLRWTAWETMYRWDLDTIPLWLVVSFLPCLSLTAVLGFEATRRTLAAGRPGRALVVNAPVIASVALIVWSGRDRAGFVGSLDEFAAGGRGNLLHSDLAVMFLVATALVFVPCAGLIVYWLRWSRDDDRAVTAAEE